MLLAHQDRVCDYSHGILPSKIGAIVIDEAHNLESRVRSFYTKTITKYSITDDLLGIIDAFKIIIKDDESLHDELMNYYSIVKKNVNILFNLFNRQIKQQQEKNDALFVESERYSLTVNTSVKKAIMNLVDSVYYFRDQVKLLLEKYHKLPIRILNEKIDELMTSNGYLYDQNFVLHELSGETLIVPTGGCVAIPEEQMYFVMQHVDPDCVVVIDSMENLGAEF